MLRPIRCALFIDFNNIAGKVPGGEFVESLSAWMAWLEDGGFDPRKRRRRFVEKRVYIAAPYEHYVPRLVDAGFEAIPSAADLLLALDAVESIYIGKNAREYIVFTVDRDFAELLERLGEREKDRVVTIERGTPSETLFPDRAEIVVPLESLKAALRYRRQPRLWRRLAGLALLPSAALYRPLREARLRRRQQAQATKALMAAADHIATLAHKTPGSPVGKRTVMKYLMAQMGQSEDLSRYFGCRDYSEMMRKVVEIRKDLRLIKYGAGGVAVMAPRPGGPAKQ